MKFCLKVIFWMIIFTAPTVLYVHGQVALFRVSYELNAKADDLKEKNESYRRLKFEVQQLKAPRLLEAKMKELDMPLEIPRDIEVVHIEAPVNYQVQDAITDFSANSAVSGRFDLLGRIIKVAQAKMDN